MRRGAGKANACPNYYIGRNLGRKFTIVPERREVASPYWSERPITCRESRLTPESADYACSAWRFVVLWRRLLVRHLDDGNRLAVHAAAYFKRRFGMSDSPMRLLAGALRQNGLVRFVEHFNQLFPNNRNHLKDLIVDRMGHNRIMEVEGRTVVNFGSDSFLGLDQDPRVLEAIKSGVETWGAHNGASRAFSSVRANADAEDKLAAWLGTEATLIYPSVTLANMGAIPGLVGRQDLLVVDEQAHNSIQEGAKIAKANGVRVLTFSHCDPVGLKKVLDEAGAYRAAVVAIDGVYSMTGELPPLAELNRGLARPSGRAVH